MAKSGSFYSNVGKHWRLQGEWKITQSITNNTSTVTLKTYWIALDKYGAIYSYVKKTAKSYIGSTLKTHYEPNAALNPNQKKLINTQTLTVKHNADGTHSGITLKVWFGMKVTLSGVFYDNRSASKKVYFDTIPRKSTVTSDANFTAGKTLAVTISRKSSKFKHKVYLYVDGVKVASASGVDTKVTLKPDNTKVFDALDGGASKGTKLVVETFIGTKSYGTDSTVGTCKAPSASTLTSKTSFTTGNSVTITLARANSSFTHTVKLTVGSWSKSWSSVGTSVTWTPTATETENIQKQITTSNSKSCTWTVTTYYQAIKVRSATSKTGTVTVNSSGRNPVVDESGCYGYDNNSTVVAITGSNRTLIQGKSNVYIYIPANIVTLRRNAIFSKYVVSCNGKTKTYTSQSSVQRMEVGTIKSYGKINVTITGYDKRGNRDKAVFTIPVTRYKGISIKPNGKRVGGLSETVSFLPAITFDTLTVNGTALQSTSNLAVTINNGSTTKTLTAVSTGTGKATAKLNNVAYSDSLPITSARTYTIIVKDIFNTSTTVKATIKKGIPSLYLDQDNPQASIGTFPIYRDSSLEVSGGIVCKSNGYYYSTDGTSRDRGYAGIDLNNSDCIGANSYAFNDSCGTGVLDTEGILFPNTGISATTSNKITGMTKLFAVDGQLYLSDYETNTGSVNVVALADVRKALWTGVYYMNENQTITPSRSIRNCPNGWCLVWSRYADGEGQNDNWNYTFIHKYHTSGGGIGLPILISGYGVGYKYVYVTDSGTKLKGNAHNDINADVKKAVLRYVLPW